MTEVVRFSSHTAPKPRAELNATFSASFSGAGERPQAHFTTQKQQRESQRDFFSTTDMTFPIRMLAAGIGRFPGQRWGVLILRLQAAGPAGLSFCAAGNHSGFQGVDRDPRLDETGSVTKSKRHRHSTSPDCVPQLPAQLLHARIRVDGGLFFHGDPPGTQALVFFTVSLAIYAGI